MKRRTISVNVAVKRMSKKGTAVTTRRVRQIIADTRHLSGGIPAVQLTSGGPWFIDSERFDLWLEKRLNGVAV